MISALIKCLLKVGGLFFAINTEEEKYYEYKLSHMQNSLNLDKAENVYFSSGQSHKEIALRS